MNTIARGARAVGRGLRESLLTLAAAGGVVCIALVIMAYVGGYSLIMFKTGSMSPTIPAGSVALVQRMPASDVVVGDVVTVDRPGELPITHRVTSIAPGAGGERVITMKGDANESADPAPYVVSHVRIVRGSLPNLAYVIVWFGNPVVLGGITVAASLLVVWAFWPRASRREDPEPKRRGAGSADAHAGPSGADAGSLSLSKGPDAGSAGPDAGPSGADAGSLSLSKRRDAELLSPGALRRDFRA